MSTLLGWLRRPFDRCRYGHLTPAEATLVGEAAEGLKESRMTA